MSQFFLNGVRTRGSTRGALPKVNGAACVQAVGSSQLTHLLTGSKVPAFEALGSTPGLRFGRWLLPNRPELLLDCEMPMGNPLWYDPIPVTAHPPSSAFTKPRLSNHRFPLPNGN